MPRISLDDVSALVAVAREQSFTKAAAKLGVSQSALSQTIRESRSAFGHPPSHAHHAQRFADGSRRARSAEDRATPR